MISDIMITTINCVAMENIYEIHHYFVIKIWYHTIPFHKTLNHLPNKTIKKNIQDVQGFLAPHKHIYLHTFQTVSTYLIT